MTPTEMARRSDSLYTDTKNMHRRQLCDMVAHRENDIEDLRDEAYGLRCDIGRLETENAKLRKAASALSQCLEWESCVGCPMLDDAGWCARDVQLRKLGVKS